MTDRILMFFFTLSRIKSTHIHTVLLHFFQLVLILAELLAYPTKFPPKKKEPNQTGFTGASSTRPIQIFPPFLGEANCDELVADGMTKVLSGPSRLRSFWQICPKTQHVEAKVMVVWLVQIICLSLFGKGEVVWPLVFRASRSLSGISSTHRRNEIEKSNLLQNWTQKWRVNPSCLKPNLKMVKICYKTF